MCKLRYKNSLWFKTIAIAVVCLFLFNEFSFALSPTSRFKPIIKKLELTEGSQEDAAFIYLNLLIGQFLREMAELSEQGLSKHGLEKHLQELKKSIEEDLPHIDFDRFKYQDMYWDGNTICVPYIRKSDGRTQTLKYYIASGLKETDPTPQFDQASIPTGNPNLKVVLEDPEVNWSGKRNTREKEEAILWAVEELRKETGKEYIQSKLVADRLGIKTTYLAKFFNHTVKKSPVYYGVTPGKLTEDALRIVVERMRIGRSSHWILLQSEVEDFVGFNKSSLRRSAANFCPKNVDQGVFLAQEFGIFTAYSDEKTDKVRKEWARLYLGENNITHTEAALEEAMRIKKRGEDLIIAMPSDEEIQSFREGYRESHNGRSPTLVEIGKHFNVSKTTIANWLEKLGEKPLLTTETVKGLASTTLSVKNLDGVYKEKGAEGLQKLVTELLTKIEEAVKENPEDILALLELTKRVMRNLNVFIKISLRSQGQKLEKYAQNDILEKIESLMKKLSPYDGTDWGGVDFFVIENLIRSAKTLDDVNGIVNRINKNIERGLTPPEELASWLADFVFENHGYAPTACAVAYGLSEQGVWVKFLKLIKPRGGRIETKIVDPEFLNRLIEAIRENTQVAESAKETYQFMHELLAGHTVFFDKLSRKNLISEMDAQKFYGVIATELFTASRKHFQQITTKYGSGTREAITLHFIDDEIRNILQGMMDLKYPSKYRKPEVVTNIIKRDTQMLRTALECQRRAAFGESIEPEMIFSVQFPTSGPGNAETIATDFCDTAIRAGYETRKKNQKLIFALGTSWIKGYKKENTEYYNAMNPLMTSMRNFCEERGIIFIAKDDSELLAAIEVAKESIENAKVVGLASENTAKAYGLIGVNNDNLALNGHVRLVEMVRATLELALDPDSEPNIPNVFFDKENNIFVLEDAGPLNFEVYRIQKDMIDRSA